MRELFLINGSGSWSNDHHSFGKDLVGQTWDLDLGSGSGKRSPLAPPRWRGSRWARQWWRAGSSSAASIRRPLALARYAIALLCLLPFALAGGKARFLRRDLLFVMGLLRSAAPRRLSPEEKDRRDMLNGARRSRRRRRSGRDHKRLFNQDRVDLVIAHLMQNALKFEVAPRRCPRQKP